MRIGLASIHPRPLSGQIEQLVGLAQALKQQGHTVAVVSPFPSEELLGPRRFQLVAPSRRILVGQPARIARVLVRLARLAPQVDVLQLNLPTPAFSMFADLLQASVRVPVVVGYEAHLVNARDLMGHGYLRQAPAFYWPRLLINNRLIARWTRHGAARYVVSSQYQKNELLQLGGDAQRIEVLPPVLPCDKLVVHPQPTLKAIARRIGRVESHPLNSSGLDLSLATTSSRQGSPTPSTRGLRRDLRSEDALTPASGEQRAEFPPGRLLTFIGHYHHVKGVEVLVRAFRALAPRFPDVSLVLAWSGVGPRRTVDQLLGDVSLQGRVYHLGQVSVPELLAASDLLALPYRLTVGQAAFPSMLVEGMAAGVPVVTTDLPLLRELTEGGKTALLAPPDDPEALAGAIECILTLPPLVQEMRRAQRQWIEQIQPERVVREYERLYRQVVVR